MATKKIAKMGHHEGSTDTGRKPTIPCRCGDQMEWVQVHGKMRWSCPACGLECLK